MEANEGIFDHVSYLSGSPYMMIDPVSIIYLEDERTFILSGLCECPFKRGDKIIKKKSLVVLSGNENISMGVAIC